MQGGLDYRKEQKYFWRHQNLENPAIVNPNIKKGESWRKEGATTKTQKPLSKQQGDFYRGSEQKSKSH